MIRELDINNELQVSKIKEFLRDNINSDYMQSIEWNIIRNEKNKYFIYYEKNGNILWSCNLLEKEKNEIRYLYAPRGPVLNGNDLNLINEFLKNMKEWMLKRNYTKLVINPYLGFDDLKYISNKYSFTITEKNDYANLLDSCKLAIMDIIFDEEKLISKLPSKFRQNTRRSYRKGLRNNISKKVDLNNFYNLYLQTAQRHCFNPHTIDYFKNLINIYKENLIFLEVWYNDIPLAMSIDIIYNNKLIYLYGVSSTENRNLLGMYNMQWEAIKYCIKNQIPQYDFGGVFCEEDDINNKDYGLYNFKKGYCFKGFRDIVPDIVFNFEGSDIDD